MHIIKPSPCKLAPPPGLIVPRLRPPACRSGRGVELSVPQRGGGGPAHVTAPSRKLRPQDVKSVDVATLGNLCVDIVLSVPELPPPSRDSRLAFVRRLSSSPPDKRYWEAGGNCNMAIAAARLGLRCGTIGHIGDEIYGEFLLEVLRGEGINVVGMMDHDKERDIVDGFGTLPYETLLCWVLVDPLQRHGFCSHADFSSEPAFGWMRGLTEEVKTSIRKSKILFCNGYGFDELSPSVLVSALDYAAEVETSIFFDPGPRGKSLSKGTPDEQHALVHFLKMSDVLLLTSDEAESLTGIDNPILAGQELLRKGIRTKWVIVKLGSRGSILVSMSNISCAPAFKVHVIDTVGCGDSFVAAIAYGFIHNLTLVNTLTIANAVGAATAMGSGAGRNVATLNKVMEILSTSNINEDDEFWEDLVNSVDSNSVIFPSKMVVNGSKSRSNCVSLQNVVGELLSELKSKHVDGKVAT